MPTSSPSSDARSRAPRALPAAVWATLRPEQWTKNAVVLVPWFFALWDHGQRRQSLGAQLLAVGVTALAFCFVSSGIYTLNDLCDAEQDRRHPVKRNRPIAAGHLGRAAARVLLVALIGGGLGLAGGVSRGALTVLAVYAGVQALYSLGLKRVALLDVFLIAGGFVLRAVAGAVAAEVRVSAWLLLCTFLLALFIACCKRRHEKAHLTDGGEDHRAALAQYDLRALDQYIAVTASAAVICYAVYTLAQETVEKFGTRALGFTVPFVVFGVFRYMDLTYRQADGERPEKVLLTDLPMIVTVILYAATAVVAFLWGQLQ